MNSLEGNLEYKYKDWPLRKTRESLICGKRQAVESEGHTGGW